MKNITPLPFTDNEYWKLATNIKEVTKVMQSEYLEEKHTCLFSPNDVDFDEYADQPTPLHVLEFATRKAANVIKFQLRKSGVVVSFEGQNHYRPIAYYPRNGSPVLKISDPEFQDLVEHIVDLSDLYQE